VSIEGRDDPSSSFDPGRLAAISDGIFAVALTLLILDVKPPNVAVSHLTGALIATAPRLGIFALSFTIVAYYWVVHHLTFAYVRVADRGLLWLNLLFLFTIVVLPFSAAVLGRYPLAAPALIVYGSNLASCSITLGLSWWYASRASLLANVNPAQARYIARRFAFSPTLAILGVVLAGALPLASLALFVAVPVLYALTSGSIRSGKRVNWWLPRR
jgi:uncharacterized membrane protein